MLQGPRTVDEISLQEFLLHDAGRLRGYMTTKIPPELKTFTSPDDILQEVWIAAFRDLPSFRSHGRDSLSRWVTTIANRRLVDALRTARAVKRLGRTPDFRVTDRRESSLIDLFNSLAPSHRTPSRETSAKENVQAVRHALSGLHHDQRRAVWMRHIEGRPVAEIAREMRKSASAVHSILFRARRQLCDYLGRASKFFSDVPPSKNSNP